MKKQLIMVWVVVFWIKGLSAQVVVNDPQANVQLTQHTFLQNIMKAYQHLQTKIQNSTLIEAVKTAKTVDKELTLFEMALDVADQFQQLQSVKDFFAEQRKIAQKIQHVNTDLSRVQGVMRPRYQQIVRKSLEDAYINAAKSISVISTSFIKKKINMADRMAFLKEAEGYLGQAIKKLEISIRIVGEATYYHENLDKAKKYYGTIL